MKKQVFYLPNTDAYVSRDNGAPIETPLNSLEPWCCCGVPKGFRGAKMMQRSASLHLNVEEMPNFFLCLKSFETYAKFFWPLLRRGGGVSEYP